MFLLRQMHACSNFTRLDVLLIQPLFILLGVDFPLQSPMLLFKYEITLVTDDNKKTLEQNIITGTGDFFFILLSIC